MGEAIRVAAVSGHRCERERSGIHSTSAAEASRLEPRLLRWRFRLPSIARGMNSPFRIKICGITSPADVRIAATAGADAVGLNFYTGSPRLCGAET